MFLTPWFIHGMHQNYLGRNYSAVVRIKTKKYSIQRTIRTKLHVGSSF
jgi:hypothetical protein